MSSYGFAVGPTVTVYDSKGSVQTDQPLPYGMVFKRGDFANTPKPLVNGSPLGSSDWQANVKTRWDDGSAKWVLFAINQTVPANSTYAITFIDNADGNNTGYLTQAQMLAFNGGTWGGQMDFGFGVTKTANAATMLNDNDPDAHTKPGNSNWGNDGLNDYWTIGPVETCVLIRDNTSASKWDFGAKWDGTTMNLNSGAAYTGNSVYASIHPMFYACFYPKNNAVKLEMIYEDGWTQRYQDQIFDITYKAGNPLAAVLTETGSRQVTDGVITFGSNVVTSATASFVSTDVGLPITIAVGSYAISTTVCSRTNSTTLRLCSPNVGAASGTVLTGVTLSLGMVHGGQRYPKTFWTGGGAAPQVLIDYNLSYLATSGMFPYFDTSVTASPDSSILHPNNCTLTDYQCFARQTQTNAQNGFCVLADQPCSFSDSGDRGGSGGIVQGFDANDEGAPTQREDALYLYNMGVDCGTANGKCAEAYYMLTGTRGDKHSSLAASITGGAGMWNNWGNFAFQMRESAVVNGYYSAAQAAKDATPATAFGTITGAAIGKPMSRYNRPTAQFVAAAGIGLNPSGSANTLGGWVPNGCAHIVNYVYPAAILTGDYFYVEAQQFTGSYCMIAQSYDQGTVGMNGFYDYANPEGAVLRSSAWTLQEVYRAALVSPDLTPEQTMYNSIIQSNAETQAGFLGLTSDSSITPTNHRACNAWSYDYTAANRWEWGRCTVASLCLNTGSACSIEVTPALHSLVTGQCNTSLRGNGTFGGSSIGLVSVATAGATTTLTTNLLPGNGAIISIVGATGNWVGMNGNWTVSSPSGSTFVINYDSSGVVGALTGNTSWAINGFGYITSVTKGNPTVLNTNNGATGYCAITGATGAGWTALNTQFTCTLTGATTMTIPLDSSGFSGSPGGTIVYNGLMVQVQNESDFIEPWMENFYTIVMGELKAAGFSSFDSITAEPFKMLTEMALDNTYNPYLTGMYARGLKNPTGSQVCPLGLSASPYFSTYAGVKSSFNSVLQALDTYNTSASALITTACDDHSYPLTSLAASAYITNTTGGCTQGACLGSDANTLLRQITPYFSNTPTNSTGCGSSDVQIKFALAAPAGAPTVTSCALSPSSASLHVSATQNVTALCDYSDGSMGVVCTSDIALFTDDNLVASTSGQTITAEGVGTANINGQTISNSTDCTPDIAVTVSAATGGSVLTPGVKMTSGTILK